MPSFWAAAAIGPTGKPTMPNRWSMPCCLRLRAIRVAPSTSLMCFPFRASELPPRVYAPIARLRKGVPPDLRYSEAWIAPNFSDSAPKPVGIVTVPSTERYDMPIYQLGDKKPVIPASCYIAETATIIGDVTLGERVSVLFGAVIRGDNDPITIGDDSNVQDNCVLHSDP